MFLIYIMLVCLAIDVWVALVLTGFLIEGVFER